MDEMMELALEKENATKEVKEWRNEKQPVRLPIGRGILASTVVKWNITNKANLK